MASDPRPVDRGIWTDLVELVPRHPVMDNEIDQRALDLAGKS